MTILLLCHTESQFRSALTFLRFLSDGPAQSSCSGLLVTALHSIPGTIVSSAGVVGDVYVYVCGKHNMPPAIKVLRLLL